MHKILTSPLIATLTVVVIAFAFSLAVMEITKPPQFADDTEVTVRIDQAKLRADVAVSKEKLANGLAGSARLPDDRGLVFVYREPLIPTFWMKGVSYPIDIVWIAGDTVTEVTTNVPPAKKGAAERDLPKYRPDGPVDKVVETAAGWTDKHSIQPGDPVRFSR